VPYPFTPTIFPPLYLDWSKSVQISSPAKPCINVKTPTFLQVREKISDILLIIEFKDEHSSLGASNPNGDVMVTITV
jgi:hypothetical protein